MAAGTLRVKPTGQGVMVSPKASASPPPTTGKLTGCGAWSCGMEPTVPVGVDRRKAGVSGEWPVGLWAGLTWASPGHGRACSQQLSSQATHTSREGPVPCRPWPLSSMARSPASGSPREANPRQASSRSCEDTKPQCGLSSPKLLSNPSVHGAVSCGTQGLFPRTDRGWALSEGLRPLLCAPVTFMARRARVLPL